MSFVRAFLEQHNLSQYVEDVLKNGYEDLNVFFDIQEKELIELGWLMGHRRKLLKVLGDMKKTKSEVTKKEEPRVEEPAASAVVSSSEKKSGGAEKDRPALTEDDKRSKELKLKEIIENVSPEKIKKGIEEGLKPLELVAAGVSKSDIVKALQPTHKALRGNVFKVLSGKKDVCVVCNKYYSDAASVLVDISDTTQRRACVSGGKCRFCMSQMSAVFKSTSLVVFNDECESAGVKRKRVFENSEQSRKEWQRAGRPDIKKRGGF